MTLLEILVGLGALMLVGFIAVRLVVESERWYVLATREMRNPATQLVERRIVADASIAFMGSTSGDVLSCVINGFGRADYYLEDGKLIRKWSDPLGAESSQQTMLERVSSFQWRYVIPPPGLGYRLIEIVVVHRPTGRPSIWSASVPLWARNDTPEETLDFVVALHLR